MRMSGGTLVTIAAFGLALAAGPARAADTYVVAVTPQVNIRTGPSTDRVIVGCADKGDVFLLIGESGSWFEIEMFSGEGRFISKGESGERGEDCSHVYTAALTGAQILPGHGMALPPSESARGLIRADIRAGRERAAREAEELLPAALDQDRHERLRGILEDGIVLEVLRIHGIQPALYPRLVGRGTGRRR